MGGVASTWRRGPQRVGGEGEGGGGGIRSGQRSRAVEVDLELPAGVFHAPDDVHFQPGPTVFVDLGRHHDDQAVGQFDLDLTEVRSHRRGHDRPAMELQQCLGDPPKILYWDVSHAGLS